MTELRTHIDIEGIAPIPSMPDWGEPKSLGGEDYQILTMSPGGLIISKDPPEALLLLLNNLYGEGLPSYLTPYGNTDNFVGLVHPLIQNPQVIDQQPLYLFVNSAGSEIITVGPLQHDMERFVNRYPFSDIRFADFNPSVTPQGGDMYMERIYALKRLEYAAGIKFDLNNLGRSVLFSLEDLIGPVFLAAGTHVLTGDAKTAVTAFILGLVLKATYPTHRRDRGLSVPTNPLEEQAVIKRMNQLTDQQRLQAMRHRISKVTGVPEERLSL